MTGLCLGVAGRRGPVAFMHLQTAPHSTDDFGGAPGAREQGGAHARPCRKNSFPWFRLWLACVVVGVGGFTLVERREAAATRTAEAAADALITTSAPAPVWQDIERATPVYAVDVPEL